MLLQAAEAYPESLLGFTATSVLTELAMMHCSWDMWWSRSSSSAVGALEPP